MNFVKKVRFAWAAAVLALILPVLPVHAADSQATVAADAPSVWAQNDVGMAYLHQLAEQDIFSNYQSAVTKGELHQTGNALLKKLALQNPDQSASEAVYRAAVVTEAVYDTTPATRADAALELYHVVQKSYPGLSLPENAVLPANGQLEALNDETAEAVTYIAAQFILQGKTDGSLDLKDQLTREELLVLAKRTYEFVLQETNTASKGLVWKVSGGKADVYVLGSIHVGDISLYPLDNLVQEAYNSADFLAVEANIVQDQAGIQYMAEKAVYTDGSTLEQHVSAETYKLFADRMSEYGYGAEVYSTLKPWYAALLLQNLSLAEATTYTSSFGLDVYFLGEAQQTGKSVLEVEGIKFQVDMFDSFSAELQESFLLSMLAGQDETTAAEENAALQAEILNTMMAYWKAGDAAQFSDLIIRSTETELEASEFNQVFWDERNHHMYETIKQYLADAEGNRYFVVVGAGHLFGETGVLKELEKAGYQLVQLLD